MEYGALRLLRSAPHVIVVGNWKGGTDKTTLAMHVGIGLLHAGQQVSMLDLDSGQRGLTCYLENRHRSGPELIMPQHELVGAGKGASIAENEAQELSSLQKAVAVASSADFLVIDTPSQDSYLTRVAHLIADTILTPVRDSFLDLCPLANLDPTTGTMTSMGPYATMVCAARKARRRFDLECADWIVVRRRAAGQSQVGRELNEIAAKAAFRHEEGLTGRAMYGRLFRFGLTMLDPVNDPLVDAGGEAFSVARNEAKTLIQRLRLPLGERGAQHAAAQQEWLRRRGEPIKLDEILSES